MIHQVWKGELETNLSSWSPAFPEGQNEICEQGEASLAVFSSVLAPQLLFSFKSGPSAVSLAGHPPTEHRTLTGPAGGKAHRKRCQGYSRSIQ